MKNSAGLIVTIVIIVAPIVWCCINLINTNNEYKKDMEQMNQIQNMEDNINDVIDSNIANNATSGEKKISGDNVDGESSESSIGAPIGKLLTGATINVSVANVYTNPDETSGIVGTVTKNTEVTAQEYPEGWTRVRVGELSGWVRTEYITKPDSVGSTTIGTVVGRTAIVNVDSLNVRKEPVNGDVITTLTLGTDVKILEVNDDETWYQIQWRTTSGWVSSKYLTIEY